MRRIKGLVAIAMVSIGLAGCEPMSWGPTSPPAPAASAPGGQPTRPQPGGSKYLVDLAVEEAPADGGGAVAAAQEAREKYLRVAEELLACQKANRKLTDENSKALAQVARLQMQSEQSQKELKEANETIVQVNRSLLEWKKDVLGRHGETQASLQALMQAQKKILILLGGEVTKPKTKVPETDAVSAKETPGGTSNGPKG